MWMRTGPAVAFLIVSATTVLAAPVRHAGEWETVIDNGPPRISCFPADQTFDEKSILRPMARLSGASCKVLSLNSVGPLVSVSMQCIIGGGVMTTSGTVLETGPDAFTSKMHSHGGAIPMRDGKLMTVPDTDMTTVSRRLGPCKPGDHVIQY